MRDYRETRAGLIAISLFAGYDVTPDRDDLEGLAAVYQYVSMPVPASLRERLIRAGYESGEDSKQCPPTE